MKIFYTKNSRQIVSAFVLSFFVFNVFGLTEINSISAASFASTKDTANIKSPVKESTGPNISSSGGTGSGGNVSPVTPIFTYLGLEVVTNPQATRDTDWSQVHGSLASSFVLKTDPKIAKYYLRLTKNTDTNVNLARGVYDFNLVSYPRAFATYIDSDLANSPYKNILEGANPAFYLYADGRGVLTLLDGSDREKHWRLAGDLPIGEYKYRGRVNAINGHQSEDITLILNVKRIDNGSANLAPIAKDDRYYFTKNNPLVVAPETILDNDKDLDSGPDALTPKVEKWPSHGTLVMGTEGSFRYVPDNNFVGADYFTYRAFDGANLSNLARVDLQINQAPIAKNDEYATRKNTRLITAPRSVLDNDIDPDGANNPNSTENFSAKVETWPKHGQLIMCAGSGGGCFSYVPDNNFVGKDTFTYRAFDGVSFSNLATVTIAIVDGDNQAPIVNNDNYTIVSGNQLNVTVDSGVLANDSDNDGPQNMTAILVNNVSSGSLTLSSDGSFTYQANSGFIGTDVFTYKVFDGLNYSVIATSTISVTAPAGGGGGGGGGSSSRRPSSASVLINNNANTTNSLVVTLTMSASNMVSSYAPLEMRIGNFSDLSSVAWRPYSTSTSWTLLNGVGTKTVYVQFKNSRGVSDVVNDSINYISGQVLGERDCSGIAGSLLAKKNTKDATVYYIDSFCKKHAFPDPKTYYTWYENFNNVKKVEVAELDLYADGGVVPYRPGVKLVKHPDTRKVYAVEANGVLREIPNPEIARSLYGPNWQALVKDVITGYFLSSYTIGSPLTVDSLANGTLVKAKNSDTIYYLENGKKRPFSSNYNFERHYFRYANIIIKDNLDNYPTGASIDNVNTNLSPYRLAY